MSLYYEKDFVNDFRLLSFNNVVKIQRIVCTGLGKSVRLPKCLYKF